MINRFGRKVICLDTYGREIEIDESVIAHRRFRGLRTIIVCIDGSAYEKKPSVLRPACFFLLAISAVILWQLVGFGNVGPI